MTQVLNDNEVKVGSEVHEPVVWKKPETCSHHGPEVCQACDFLSIYYSYAECPWRIPRTP